MTLAVKVAIKWHQYNQPRQYPCKKPMERIDVSLSAIIWLWLLKYKRTKLELSIALHKNTTMGECNTVLSAYTLYRHLG